MKVYYDRDADLSALKGKKIAVIGFGSQGHAHALNLRDSGMDVCVGLGAKSPSREKAAKQGLPVFDTAEAAKAPGNRRRRRVFGAAGIGQYCIDARIIGHRPRETVGVGGATEDQDAQWSGRGGCHDGER